MNNNTRVLVAFKFKNVVMEDEEICISRCCSDWMSEMSAGFWDIPLWNLAIPGSHDTMTYCLDQQSSVLKSEPWVLRVLAALFPCIVRPCIIKWATTQVIPSLQECWNHSYQVILSYDDSAASGHKELWPRCEYWWANTSDPNRVISYLEERKEEGRPDRFFAAGLNLTEDARYILCHPCQSLQSMTLSSYSLLLNWVKQQRPGSGKTCLNIICADFVGVFSNEFTQLVIGLNQRLLKET